MKIDFEKIGSMLEMAAKRFMWASVGILCFLLVAQCSVSYNGKCLKECWVNKMPCKSASFTYVDDTKK